jgi:hypothetical protein
MPVHGFPTFAAAAAAAAAAASIFIRIRMFMHINVHASCNLSNLACRGFIPHSDHDSDEGCPTFIPFKSTYLVLIFIFGVI